MPTEFQKKTKIRLENLINRLKLVHPEINDIHEQKSDAKKCRNMAVDFGHGKKLWIQPITRDGINIYQISASGESTSNMMVPYLKKLFDRIHDGQQQSCAQPRWETSNWKEVLKIIEFYVDKCTQ